MKKFNISLIILAMSSLAFAGGDVVPPIDPVVTTPETPDPVPVVTIEDKGLYLGLGYGFLNIDRNTIIPGDSNNYSQGSGDYDQFLLLGGYKFNPYFAIEARTWLGMSTHNWLAIDNNTIQRKGSIDVWGVYLKPIYPITEKLDVYALLGYGNSAYDIEDYASNDLDGFSWGVGGAYDFNQNWSMFVDYTLLYDGDYNTRPVAAKVWKVHTKAYAVSVGINYKF